ncbi:MAG: Asp-tRNA(Asn)/Glu-tRNA(Gln) amidotransferase GatCAB subunit A, partial [Chloroflexi bacterium]|nr:Asp-tRNA(Asn)/Glu-tRNA(Gln) amidotransferase GatCAB subunit A [Chloroflexota bacterium]
LARELRHVFRSIDVLATPTVGFGAPRLDEPKVTIGERAEDVGVAVVRLTRPFNVAGLPALTLPAGLTTSGMPVGLQLAAVPFAEATLLRAAAAYEAASDWVRHRPSL